jgi:hypothetical protein
MSKVTKSIMHVWISLASIAAFVFGWAIFAHADKPAPLVVQQTTSPVLEAPALEPIPSIDELLLSSSRSMQLSQRPASSFPRLRTRGS